MTYQRQLVLLLRLLRDLPHLHKAPEGYRRVCMGMPPIDLAFTTGSSLVGKVEEARGFCAICKAFTDLLLGC